MRALIVNADDFGSTAEGDARILAAHLEGVVRSTTLLVGGPHAVRALAEAAARAPQLAIGLHVDLAALVPGGPLAVVRALPALKAGEVAAAASSQVSKFIEMSGRAPDHLDCHQHLAHLAPRAFAEYLSVARANRLPVRSPAPFLSAPALAAFCARVERENGVPLAAALPPPGQLAPALARVWGEHCVPAPDRFEHGFYGSRATTETLLHVIRTLSDGVTELMCHPARDGEREALTDRTVRGELERAGVTLATFAALSRAW